MDRTSSPRLDARERRRLRGLAHDLEPVVQVGQRGLTSAVVEEVDRALQAHELIKVRLVGSRDEKREMGDVVADRLSAAIVHRIGHLVVLYRPRDAE